MLGAAIVVIGLTLFVLVGDPDAGVESASTTSLLLATLAVSAVAGAIFVWMRTKTSAGAARRGTRRLRRPVLRPRGGLRETGPQRPPRQHRRSRRRLAHVGTARLRLRRLRDPAALARHRTARACDGRGLGLEPGGQRAPRDRALRGTADASRLARPGRVAGPPRRPRRRRADHARKPRDRDAEHHRSGPAPAPAATSA